MTQRVPVAIWMREDYASGRSWDGFADMAAWVDAFCAEVRALGFRYICTAGAKSSRWAAFSDATPIYYVTHTTETFGQYQTIHESAANAWRATTARIVDSTHMYLRLLSQVTFDSIVRSGTAHVSKDYGAGHFDDFSHDFEFYWDSASDQHGEVLLWGVTDAPAGYTAMTEGFGVSCYDNNNAPYLRIQEFVGDTYSNLLTISSDTLYYATIARSGTTATLQVFTDAARTSQVGTDRTLTVTTDAKRYLLAFASAASSWNPTDTATGYTRNFGLDDGEGEVDIRLLDEVDPGGDLTTMPTISVAQTFTNGSVSADVASPAPVQQTWSGSAPWNDTLKIIMAAAVTHGLGVYVDALGWFEGGFAGWNGMHLWHEWNTGLNHWDQITWEGEQHHDVDFFDEMMAYGDAFAGTWVLDTWRWYQGMADFYEDMHDYTGRQICLPCTTQSWWYDYEFSEEPRATATPEVYGYHLGSGGDEAYEAYIDYITTSEEQSLWDADQGICHQGDPWLVEHGGYGGQITWDRLVYAHEAGIRGPFLIYTDDDAPFWDLDILGATQSFEQARTDLIEMLALFNLTYGRNPGDQPGPGAWYL